MIAEKFRILEVLGQGSMGTVYAAEHLLLKKKMAVKILHPELTSVKSLAIRFEREATATAKIDHPNVAAALDFGTLADGSMFLALEFVEGRSLRSEIQKGPLTLGRALRIVRQLASVLAVTQPLGIVHRDLKPENIILVQRDEDSDFVKVLDFGIARIADPSDTESGAAQPLTKLGAVFGTPEYMAPEQALGQRVDTRADFFSLGVILFEMLAGVRPFQSTGGHAGILAQQITQPRLQFSDVAPNIEVPEAVERVVNRLLAKGVAERYQRASDIVQHLDELLRNPGSVAAPLAAVPAPLPAFDLNTQLGSPITANPLEDEQAQAVVGSQAAASAEPVDAPAPRDARATRLTLALGLVRQRLAGAIAVARAHGIRAHEWLGRRFGPRFSRIPPVALAMFGAGLALGLLVAALVWITSGNRQGTAESPARMEGSLSTSSALPDPSASASAASSSSERVPDPSKDPEAILAAAQAKIDEQHDLEAVGLIAKVLSKNPERRSDAKVAEMLYALANSSVKDAADLSFSLLEGTMSTQGADLLYRLWLDKSVREPVRRRAEKWIRSEPFSRAASNSTQVATRLRLAETCAKKYDLLPMAAKGGTALALAYLKELDNARDCGVDGKADCYPCLRKDDRLRNAIDQIEARSGK